jgi:SAM-dependent methyltransferase
VNGALETETRDLPPGTVLDVGCGEGGDAVWLAQRGWEVTAVDISQVALDRARRATEEAGVTVSFVRADIGADGLPGTHDLVSVHYPALRRSPGNEAIEALLGAVAPGGTLLLVGHDVEAMTHHVNFDRAHFDPADYVQPHDVARLLDDRWTIDVEERRDRVNPPGHDGPDVPDVVLRARRKR